jgi:hypothetical protein
MKFLEIVAYRSLQALSISLGLMLFAAFTFAVVQLLTGNYHGTASRTF